MQLGEGDCDSDSSCAGNLKCGTDNCVGEFFDATDDCCYLEKPETTEKPNPLIDIDGSAIDCKAIDDAQLILRTTRLAYGCNPAIGQKTCSKTSCLQDILEKSSDCARESEKLDCPSLEKVSAAFSTLSKEYCEDGPISPVCFKEDPAECLLPKGCVGELKKNQYFFFFLKCIVMS